MAEPIPYPVLPLVRHHNTHHYSLRTGEQRRNGQCWLARTPLAHHFTQFEANVCFLSWAPYDQLLASQLNNLLLCWWPTDRRLRPCSTWGYAVEQTWSGTALFFTLQLLATDNGRLRITSARHKEDTAWGGMFASPMSTMFWARHHAALWYIDLVVGHGRSGVPLSNKWVRQHGLTPTLREDRSGKRALETLCHTHIAISPQDTTDHVSGPAKPNVTWDTNVPQETNFLDPITDWTTRPCA